MPSSSTPDTLDVYKSRRMLRLWAPQEPWTHMQLSLVDLHLRQAQIESLQGWRGRGSLPLAPRLFRWGSGSQTCHLFKHG